MERMEKKSSQQKSKDRLSTLPNEILLEILGNLPINTAATTTVLSHRWHDLWTQITSIRINRDYFAVTRNQEFPNVFKLLEKLTSPVIKTCDLFFPKPIFDDDTRPNNPVCYPISLIYRKYSYLLVKHTLDRGGKNIRLVLGDGGYDWSFMSVGLLNVCHLKSLVALELDDWCTCDWVLKDGENNVCLHFLRKLTVPIHDSQVKVLPVIIKSCPSLEHLNIIGHLSHDHHNVIEISAQKLKLLVLRMWLADVSKQVVIDAHRLRELTIFDNNHLSTYSFVKTPTALVAANVFRCLETEQPPHQQLKEQDLIRAVSFASVINLISPVFQYMNQQVKVPVFVHLTSLNVGFGFQRQWQGLMHFFAFLPNLQRLDIASFDDAEVKASNLMVHDDVPTCLSTKVEFIKIIGLKAVRHELEIISYLLRVANVLKTLDIKVSNTDNSQSREIQVWKELDFCEQLYKIRKSSSDCQLSFTGIYVNVSVEGLKVGALDSRILFCT